MDSARRTISRLLPATAAGAGLLITAPAAPGQAGPPGECAIRPRDVQQQVLSTGLDSAIAVYVADLDDDLDLDIVAASLNDDTIAWYESDGGSPPTFTEHIVSTAADSARWVHADDVNGDGDVDILAASANDDTIAWYESDGGSPPTFTERIITTSADSARCVFTADIDGDLDVDVLSASANDDRIRWFENDGQPSPTFTEHVITAAADSARCVVAADLDGDLDIDAAVASANDDTVSWYENDGGSPPSFTEHILSTTRNAAQGVWIADLDGDLDLDIIAVSQFDDEVGWYENDGGNPAGFTEHIISTDTDGAFGVNAGDMDDDGDVDIIVAAQMEDQVYYFSSDGNVPPAFTRFSLTDLADGPRSAFPADLDGDLDLDFALASSQDDTVAWYALGPPVLGVCCLSDGSCVDDVCLADCAALDAWAWHANDTCLDVTCPGSSAPAQFLVDNLSLDNFKQYIVDLAAFETRYWNRQGNEDAVQYLVNKLEEFGYDNVVLDPYEFENQTKHNIYATKMGKTRPTEMYIFSAHMDSFNINGLFDNAPGADDDASGCALVLEAARVFARAETEVSVRFVFWNNEETGLNGSRAYATTHYDQQGTLEEPTWLGVIQHDMIMYDHGPGFPPDADVEYQQLEDFQGLARILANFVSGAMSRYGEIPSEVGTNMRNTDSVPFQELVASISVRENTRDEIGNGSNPHWHQVTDRPETYTDEDYLHGFNIARMTIGALGELAGARDTGRPKDFVVIFGSYVSGTVVDLWESDDSDVVIEQRPAFTPLLPLIRVEIDGTSTLDDPAALTFTYEAAATALPPNVPQRLELRNYDTNSWEMIDTRLATLGDQVVEVTIDTNAGRFIDDGTLDMRARANYFDPGNVISPAWTANIDQALWTLAP